MPSNPHSHHGRHHGNHFCQKASINPSCCSSCCCCCNSSSSPPLPPPSISIDQLLQYMAIDLIKIQPFLKPQQIHAQTHQNTEPLLNALSRRVFAVETSLSQLTSHSPPNKSPPPPPPSCCRPHSTPSPSSPHPPMPTLREVAARTIQAGFRRFLVRRSQTLRDIKSLASIKSNTASLRSLLSGDTDAEPDDLSQKAMNLLLQLDSIQSSDPMIRDGKRSISRELTVMLDFIEKVLVRERRLSLRSMEVQEDPSLGLLRSRSSKKVSFAEGGKESKEVFPKVFEEEVFGYENGAGFHSQDFGLSAPLPLQMEPRLGF